MTRPETYQYEEDEMCANCGTQLSECRTAWRLNNDDVVCTRRCYDEYVKAWTKNYFNPTRVKVFK